MPHSSRSWCQSAELRASREHSRPSTIPALPRDTSATSCWNPSRSAADAPEWPWPVPVTVIWSPAQPSATALPRRSYWRIADSVLLSTCLRVDWQTYSLNNQCGLEGSDVVAGQGGFTKAAGRLWLMPASGNKEKLGDPFGTGCPLSVAPRLRSQPE